MSAVPKKLPRILCQIDHSIPEGAVAVGGACILANPTDEELGWAITAKLMRACDSETMSRYIMAVTHDLGAVELKWIDDPRPPERFTGEFGDISPPDMEPRIIRINKLDFKVAGRLQGGIDLYGLPTPPLDPKQYDLYRDWPGSEQATWVDPDELVDLDQGTDFFSSRRHILAG